MVYFGKLYTVGYAAFEGIEQLQELLTPDVMVVDIRYYPSSRWRPEWSRKRLIERFAPNYYHIRELGNIHYRSPQLPIELLDAEVGISWVLTHLQSGRDICLLCACADWQKCHRRKVSELIQNKFIEIQPIHLSPALKVSCAYS